MLSAAHPIEHGLPPPRLAHQWETYSSKAKFTLQSGAYGSGKTLTNAWIILRECLEYPGTLGLAGAETTPQLRETLQADFEKLVAGYMTAGLITYHGTERKYTFWNGSKVLFWPLVGSNAKAQRHRLRSLNLGFAVIEEITAIPEATVLEVKGRLRRKRSSRQMWASCNPDSPEHYLYEMFERNPQKGTKLVKSNTYANPYLPDDYIKDLETSLGEEMASRYLKGEWVNFKGLVYKDFRRELHVVDPIPLSELRPLARWGALDFGGANPHCMLWFAEDALGYIYITGEWYKAQEPLSAVAKALKSDEVTPVYCDHDAADRLTLSQDHKVRGLVAAKKEKGRGIAKVQEFLKPVGEGMPPRLRIFSTCINVIKEIGGYRWPEGTDARDPANEPVKKNDHALDALRYGIFTRFGGPAQPGVVLSA